MKCFCCGKPLHNTDDGQELLTGWHNACIRKFFGTNRLPLIDISEENLTRIAMENVEKGCTVPGVQKKMSLHLNVDKEPRLTLVDYPSGYILKPQTGKYASLPEAEYLVMQMAKFTGISTVPFALLSLNQDSGTYITSRADSKQTAHAYITKRIDRILPTSRNKQTQMLAMEDFCQLDNRITADKYHGSYERCAKIVSKYSNRPGLDMTELFLRIVFSYVTGNSDMHLKNFSLIETAPGNREYILSAAYDMLPVNIILPDDTEQLALTLNGKKRNLHRNDFLKFADYCDIPKKAAERLIQKVTSKKDLYQDMCMDSYLPPEMKQRFMLLIQERTETLTE